MSYFYSFLFVKKQKVLNDGCKIYVFYLQVYYQEKEWKRDVLHVVTSPSYGGTQVQKLFQDMPNKKSLKKTGMEVVAKNL